MMRDFLYYSTDPKNPDIERFSEYYLNENKEPSGVVKNSENK